MTFKSHEVRAKARPKTSTKPMSRRARAVRTVRPLSVAAERERSLNQIAATGAPSETIDPNLLPGKPCLWEPSHTHGMNITGTGYLGGHESRQPAAPMAGQQPSPIVSTQSSDRNEFDTAFSDIEKNEPFIRIPQSAAEWLKLWLKQKKCLVPSAQELSALEVITKSTSYEIMAWLTAHGSSLINKDVSSNDNSFSLASSRCRVTKSHRSKVQDTNAPEHVYECTNGCETRFSKTKRHEWIRHEEENIEVWECRLCPSVLTRKDKLREHLRNIHHEGNSDLEAWRKEFRASQEHPCGFCQSVFEDWKLWLSHVGAHFEGRLPGGVKKMSDWCETHLSTDAKSAHTHNFDDSSNAYSAEIEEDFGGYSSELFNGFQGFSPPDTSGLGFFASQVAHHQAPSAPENQNDAEKPLTTDGDLDIPQRRSHHITLSPTQRNPPLVPRHSDLNEKIDLDLMPSMAALSFSPPLQTFRTEKSRNWADYPPTQPATASSDEEDWSQYTCSCADFLRNSPQGGGSAGVPIESLPSAVGPRRCTREFHRVQLRRYETEPLDAGPYFAGHRPYSNQSCVNDQGSLAEFVTGARL